MVEDVKVLGMNRVANREERNEALDLLRGQGVVVIVAVVVAAVVLANLVSGAIFPPEAIVVFVVVK